MRSGVLATAAALLLSLLGPIAARAETSAEASRAWRTAQSLLDQGRPDIALEKLREAVKLAPGDIDIHREYIDLMVQEGFPGELLSEYQGREGSANDLYLHGRAMAAVGDLAGARAKFQAALGRDRTHHWALQGMGSLALLEGRVDDAIGLLKGAVAAAPGRADVHNRLAAAYVRKGDIQNAYAAWREATQADPSDHHAWLNWGALLSREGDQTGAAEKLRTAVERAPGYPLAHVNLAYVYVRLAKYDDAVAHLEAALAINPRNTTVAGSRDLVRRIAKGTAPKTSFDVLAEALESETLDPARAAQKYKELVALVPDFASGWMRLGLVHAALGDGTESLTALEKAVKIAPNDAAARYNLGYLLLGLDRAEDARPHLEVAHKLEPKDPDAITAMALVHLSQRNAEEALRWYDQAIALSPSDPTLWVQYGTTQAAMGEFAAGAASVRKALAIAPGFLPARAQLVTILREGRRYDEALTELEALEAVAPNNASIAAERASIEAARTAQATAKAGGVRVSQVLVTEEAQGREALAALRSGGDFPKIARKYGKGPEAARGGEVGYVKPSELRSEVATALAALKPGQISELIPLGTAWLIIRREE